MRTTLTPRTKRTIRAAIATTMLTVPASALALSGVTSTQAASGAPLHATATPRVARLGQTITVQGAAPSGSGGHQAVLETASLRRSDWRPLGQTTIAPDGRFAFRARLRHSGYVRVIDTGPAQGGSVQASAAAVAERAASTAERVQVAAAFKIAQHRLQALAGHPVTVHGTLSPGRAGRVVRVQTRVGPGWRTLSTTRTGQGGRFRARFAPQTGSRLRLSFAGDGSNAPATGRLGRLQVFGADVASWYDDAGNTACGYHATYGVANRTLPCGTKVQIRFGGRTVTATVDDRGPYVGGRDWDLNQNTAAALHFGGVGQIWISL